jgi:outer membrane lipoprotein-sorting protein
MIGIFQVCCAIGKPFVSPTPEKPTIETAEDAKQLLMRSYGSVRSLKASGEIEVRFGENERKPATFALMLERVAKLRMRIYRPLVPFIFEMVSDGNACWFYIPSEKTAYRDEDCGSSQSVDGGMAISAETIIAALVVVADPGKLLDVPAELEREDSAIGLRFNGEGGTRREIWLDPQTGLAARQLYVGREGVTQVEIVYGKQAFQEKAVIPIEIEIFLPQRYVSVLLRISDLSVDPPMPAAAFEFLPPVNTRILASKDINQDWFRK